MIFLLDTHILLWYLEGNSALHAALRTRIENPEHRILVSVVSLWEIVIKSSLGKLKVSRSIDEIVTELHTQDMALQPITLPALATLQTLPFHHRDPFDRLLIAEAMSQGMTLMTDDPQCTQYPVQIVSS